MEAVRVGKHESTLHGCISVTDFTKINEQNKSIDIGPLYLQTEFEALSLLLQKVMAGFNPVGYRALQYWHGPEQVQDSRMYFTIEKWCGMKC